MTRGGRQWTGAIREGIVPLDRQFTAGFSDSRVHKVSIWFCLADLVATSGEDPTFLLVETPAIKEKKYILMEIKYWIQRPEVQQIHGLFRLARVMNERLV
jgi:hypothetical protein